MKKYVGYLVVAMLLPIGGVAGIATAGNHGDYEYTTTNGHTPVTICHKPGTPAQQTLVVDDDSVELTGHLGHGDTIGPCGEVVDYCPTLEGVQAEDEDCPVPTETTPTETTPTNPGQHNCVYTGAGKDGNVDAYGGHNDDCAPLSTPVTPKPTDPQVQVVTVPQVVTVTVTTPGKTRVVTKTKTKVKVVHKTKVIVKRKIVVKYKKKIVCPKFMKLYKGICTVPGKG